jgi:nitrogen fixation protein FixH
MSRLRPGRRTAAILAILLLLVAAGSDFVIADFWVSHPMLTAIVSALVVVVLSVTVIEVVLSRRSERRWRVLAQQALIELAEAANTTWSAIAEALGLQGGSEMTPEQVRAALASDATGPQVRRKIESDLKRAEIREQLAGKLDERLADGHQLLGRWAVALTASQTYAEIFDRHVELYGRVNGLLQFLREGYKQTDPRGLRGRVRREYSSPGGEAEDEWFVDNLIGTINIGAGLEDETWDLALQVLPQDWWDRRTVQLAAAARGASS